MEKGMPCFLCGGTINDGLINHVEECAAMQGILAKVQKTMVKLDKNTREKVKRLMKKTDSKIALECMECGHKFKRANPGSETKCPKCHGRDIDLDYSS